MVWGKSGNKDERTATLWNFRSAISLSDFLSWIFWFLRSFVEIHAENLSCFFRDNPSKWISSWIKWHFNIHLPKFNSEDVCWFGCDERAEFPKRMVADPVKHRIEGETKDKDKFIFYPLRISWDYFCGSEICARFLSGKAIRFCFVYIYFIVEDKSKSASFV